MQADNKESYIKQTTDVMEDVELKQLIKQLNYWHEKNSKLMDPIGCLPENVTIRQDHKA